MTPAKREALVFEADPYPPGSKILKVAAPLLERC
jgi:hypothetical protein